MVSLILIGRPKQRDSEGTERFDSEGTFVYLFVLIVVIAVSLYPESLTLMTSFTFLQCFSFP